MGISHKSHDRKSDKETQSPMLRVFKEMMQKENKDIETANLIKEKPEKSTKKSCTRIRSKIDQKADSSCLDGQKNKQKKKMAERFEQDQSNWTNNENATQSYFQPYQSGKRDSWWLWREAENKKTEDTCSCATCPLKRLMGTDYACMGCLIVLFMVSVLITSMVVFKTLPFTLEHKNDGNMQMELKRQMVTEQPVETTPRDIWSPDLINKLESYSGIIGAGYGDSSFRDTNILDDEGKVSSELANVIGAEKLDDVQGSDKLREFYKKLIQTDAQIKLLKQGAENNYVINTDVDNSINVPERYKRSMKLVKSKYHNVRYNTRNKHGKRFNMVDAVTNKNKIKTKRLKRDNYKQPEGYVIEKKKIFIHYKPLESKRQFPKCSHTPNDSKSHEKDMKHPFYQNSQRLDELLDHILDRNIPEIVRDPLTLDLLFSNKVKCNHRSENKSSNIDTSENLTNNVENLDTDTKDESSTYKTDLNIHDNFKEMNSKILPTIDTFVRNITLFDEAMENNNNFENLYNIKASESDHAKHFTDPSSSVMSKIHHSNNLETSAKNQFGNNANKNEVSNNMNTVLNNKNYRTLYKQNLNQKIAESKIDSNQNILADKNDNLMIDDARTERTFDINLDYSDIVSSTTPKISAPHTTISINQEKQKDTNIHHYINDWQSHSLRKLLQIEEEDDDILGYEDFKEFLADEMEAHDETDRRVDRKKRNKNIPDVYNRNWKGPIPLYPDEVNAIIKQAAIENIKLPLNTKDVIGIDKVNNQMSDTDYIEDYFDNKYDRLVKVAQAYSDYGVLGSKKEDINQNKVKTSAKKDKNIIDTSNCKTNTRSRKGTVPPSEGIRFEYKPGKVISGTNEPDIVGTLQKHFKILKGNKHPHTKTTENPYTHADFHSLPIDNAMDKEYKLRSKAIEESISVPKRSLKSIENIDVEDLENVDGVVIAIDVNDTIIDKNIKFVRDVNETEKNQTNVTLKDDFDNHKNYSNSNTTSKVSHFFAMMSDWFRLLANLSGETSSSDKINSSTLPKDNMSVEVSYPSYDADMIENIGHRSRVLLSIEDKNASLTTEDINVKEEDKTYNNKKQYESTTQSNFDRGSNTLVTEGHENATIENKASQVRSLKDDTNIENRTISKRSIRTGSRLNFWNEIYDDEYGVRLDYFENSRDKHSINADRFVKKSKNWIEKKVKNIANKLRSTKITTKDAKAGLSSTVKITPKITSTPKRNIKKRRIRNLFNEDAEDPHDFVALTANMKKVVREATEAVKETRKLKVRDDSKEETMASSLMQQLVRLMTDVVDFQVQQKTCAKLPPDLQKFLVRLTSVSDKEAPPLDLSIGSGYDANNLYNKYDSSLPFGKKSDDDNLGVGMPENHLDDRTQYLKNIQAVQELITQYGEMNDEDKSKMTGVKEYLENQLNFLNNKVTALDGLSFYKYFKKRETPDSTYHDSNWQRNAKLKRRRNKRTINKFIKNYDKKHTKTTVGNIEDITEAKDEKKSR